MAEHDRPPVGSVAEEASRLLDALGGWAGAAAAAPHDHASHDHTSHDHTSHDHTSHDHEPHDHEPHDPASGDPASPGADANDDVTDDGVDGSPLHGTSRCESCGAENGVGQAVTCQLCPVCQGIALVRSVRPETVDRLADLAGAIAATLRDLADQRRAGAEGATPRHGSARAGAHGSRVQDIRIDPDDETGEAL